MAELPDEVVDEAVRLTRLARGSTDDAEATAYRDERDRLLGEHDYLARIRDSDEVLVCYPADWMEGGTVRLDLIEDTTKAVERGLGGSAGEEAYEAVAAHNRELVRRVAENHGPVHAANAAAFAAFMGNHYARRIESATATEVREFLEEYYPRNAWPTEEEAAAVEGSLRRLFKAAGRSVPTTIE